MERIVHVVNGDSTADTLSLADLPGDIRVWADALDQGPVLPVSDDEHYRTRGEFWAARVGGFHDRITVAHAGIFSYGTRIESRAYLGAWMRFGQVAISAVEGIELDPEPYAVWFVHDKAFLGIQSTF